MLEKSTCTGTHAGGNRLLMPSRAVSVWCINISCSPVPFPHSTTCSWREAAALHRREDGPQGWARGSEAWVSWIAGVAAPDWTVCRANMACPLISSVRSRSFRWASNRPSRSSNCSTGRPTSSSSTSPRRC
ncbi:hypothetical protein SBV1_1960011 [Verrucomicrobia bacterium]|nr:hypothetical protein SBV1_1960011 [Verrucomicrobiota bacterium]